MDICTLRFLGAFNGFTRLFSILPWHLYDFTLKNLPGLLNFIGIADNWAYKT